MALTDIAAALGVDLQDVPSDVVELAPALTSASLTYRTQAGSLVLALGAKVAKASVNVLLASVGTAKKSDGGGVGSRKNALVLAVPFRAGLGDLPVVGPLLPHGIDVGVAGLGLLAASADFAKTECDTINAQLPEHAARMPSPLKAGVAVLVEAALGRDTQSIELRLPKKGHRGTVAFGDGGAGGVQAVAWWDISRALGPVRIERFGARYAAGSIGALLDAQVSAGGLTLEPRGLGVTVPLKAPHTPSVCLDGLGIGLDRPPVKLAAALLLQSPPPAGYRFAVAGMAVIEVPAVSVEAVGFYAHPEHGGEPSLFLFGTLGFSKQGGVGPPQFRVKKFAAGFGYNSAVREVPVAEMDSFPFLQMLAKSSEPVELEAEPSPAEEALDALAKLTQPPAWVTPQPGQTWIAGGLEFVAFEFVTAQALALVQFGAQVSVEVLLHASAPFPKAPASPYALVEVDAKAGYYSGKDVFSLDATIKDTSFVLDRACRLGGDLALRAWFGRSEHPGDFVFTLGGYHPAFEKAKPPHYPAARRLSINWPTDIGVSISGSAYAALTPSSFMVGSSLEVRWEWGNLWAGFSAKIDALVQWAPFHFDISVALSAWAGVDLGFTRLDAEVSISVRVCGPPTGGSANFSVFGFDYPIDFGAPPQRRPEPLKSQQFRDQLLPHTGEGGARKEDVLEVRPLTGMRPEQQSAAVLPAVRQVSSLAFSCETHSAVPVTEIILNGASLCTSTDRLSVRPMEATGATSTHTVVFTRDNKRVDMEGERWRTEAVPAAVPKALWGPRPDDKKPELDPTLKGYFTGVRIGVPPAASTSDVLWKTKAADIGVERLAAGPMPLSASARPRGPVPYPWKPGEKSHVQVIVDEIAGLSGVRAQLLAALPEALRPADANDPLTAYSTVAAQQLCAEPLFATGWESAP